MASLFASGKQEPAQVTRDLTRKTVESPRDATAKSARKEHRDQMDRSLESILRCSADVDLESNDTISTGGHMNWRAREWKQNEMDKLIECVKMHGETDQWDAVAEDLGLGRSPLECKKYWTSVVYPNYKNRFCFILIYHLYFGISVLFLFCILFLETNM